MTRVLPGRLGFMVLLMSLTFTSLCLADDVIKNGKFTEDLKYWGNSNRFGEKPAVADVDDLKENNKAVKFDIKDADPKKNWMASLTQTLEGYVPKNTKITLKFKAKGSTDKIIEALVQLNGKPYTQIVNSGKLSLTDSWQAYSYTGTAKENFTPGSIRVYFPFGQNDGTVQLADISVEMPDSGLPPVGEPLNFNHVFAADQAGWSLPSTSQKDKCEYSFFDLATHRVLKMDVKQGNPPKPWEVSITNYIKCNVPKNTKAKLMVRARSQTPDATFNLFLEGKDRHKERLVNLPDQKLGEDWKWYTSEVVIAKDAKPNDIRIVLQLGAMQQVIEFDQIGLIRMADVTAE